MARNAVLRELGLEHFFDEDDGNWLFDDSLSDSDEENEDVYEIRRQYVRRPYTLRSHAELDEWDDVAFYQRFRMTKRTFRRVVDLVEPHLAVAHRR